MVNNLKKGMDAHVGRCMSYGQQSKKGGGCTRRQVHCVMVNNLKKGMDARVDR